MSVARRVALLEAQQEISRRRRKPAVRRLRLRTSNITLSPTRAALRPTLAPMPPLPAALLFPGIPGRKTKKHDDVEDIAHVNAATIEAPEIEEALADTAVMETVAEVEQVETQELDPVEDPTEVFDAIEGTESEPERHPEFAPEPEPEPEPKPKRRRRKAPFVVTGILAVAGAGYLGAAAWAGTAVADGVSVAGVDLSGMSAAQARDALEPVAAKAQDAPLVFTIDTFEVTSSPADAGLTWDLDATVNSLVGFSLDPSRIVARIAGGQPAEPLVAVDSQVLAAAIADVALQVDGDVQEPEVFIEGTQVVTEGGRPGLVTDQEGLRDLVEQDWPLVSAWDVPAEVTEPDVTRAAAEAFAQQANTEWLDAPITLTGPNGDIAVEPATWLEHASVAVEGGVIALEVDGEALTPVLLATQPGLVNQATLPSISFDAAHQIVVVASQPAREIDAAALGDAVVQAAKDATASAPMPYVETEPAPIVEGLDLGHLTTKVSSFDTPLTSDRVRTRNLIHAAEKVTGTVLLPGQSFDLYETLSPITIEDGYVESGIISNGIHTTGVGGGLSQMATTSYNAAYFAGFDLVEHRPHSVWFQRYPPGRESTIFGTTVNVVFTNDTPYAAVMNSYVENNRLYVEVWSTPHYTVETSNSGKLNVVQPGVTVLNSPDCEPSAAGEAGFTITNYRKVYLDGTLVKDEADTWTYRPDNQIVCESA